MQIFCGNMNIINALMTRCRGVLLDYEPLCTEFFRCFNHGGNIYLSPAERTEIGSFCAVNANIVFEVNHSYAVRIPFKICDGVFARKMKPANIKFRQ